MSTGHTTYTTFHADTVGEVLKRFTTEPINVSKTMFTALDLLQDGRLAPWKTSCSIARKTLDEELRKRRVVLAYLIDRGLSSYAQVAATFQAFINDPETVLALMANEELERSLEDLREMESVLISVDRDKEEMVPRPDPDEAGREEVEADLSGGRRLFAEVPRPDARLRR